MADLTLRFPHRPATSRIRIAPGALEALGAFARSTTGATRVALVSDPRVDALYGSRARRSLERAGLAVARVLVPRGERAKSAVQLARLWERLAAADLGRRDAVVALGGGVVGDLAGFAAATWLRGVPWVCVPTTLLAQVDSSVGGKTAIDLAAGKNLAGAFHQPAGVLVDPELLATLAPRERRAGLAEVVKTGMAADATLFRFLEHDADALAAGDARALARAVAGSIRTKARVVLADEREREGGGRTALNLGHTTAHALESALGFERLLHGEAVAIGLRVAASLSERVAGLPRGERVRLEALLDHFGLPERLPAVAVDALLAPMRMDKKRAGAQVRWVLTPHIGSASVPRSIDLRIVRSALIEAGARARRARGAHPAGNRA